MPACASRATSAAKDWLDIIHNPKVGMTGPVIRKADQLAAGFLFRLYTTASHFLKRRRT